MGRLRKFFRLPGSDRRLLGKTWLLVAAIRLGLAVLPFSSVLFLLKRFSSGNRDRSPSESHAALVQRLAWSIEVACRYVPWADTCLVKALAMQALLERRGWPAKLCLGACRDGDSRLEAHAWVESDGVVVIGGTDLERYTLLTPSGERSPQEAIVPRKPLP